MSRSRCRASAWCTSASSEFHFMNAQVVSAAEMIAENNAQKQSPYTGATMRLLDSILSTNNVMTSNSPVNNLAGMNLQFQVPVNDFLLNHTKSYMEV